jgi:hypothetical protein
MRAEKPPSLARLPSGLSGSLIESSGIAPELKPRHRAECRVQPTPSVSCGSAVAVTEVLWGGSKHDSPAT